MLLNVRDYRSFNVTTSPIDKVVMVVNLIGLINDFS